MTIAEEIAKLKAALESPATPENQKEIFRKVIKDLESKQASETKEVKSGKADKKNMFDNLYNEITLHEDGGHAWLQVPKKWLSELGIASEITEYSYEKGDQVYLEEDQDVSTFVNALKKIRSWDSGLVHSTYDDRSPIRNYPSYKPTGKPEKKPGKLSFKASKEEMEKAFGKDFMESKDKGRIKEYETDNDEEYEGRKKKKSNDDEYDCDDLIEKAKKAAAKRKKAAAKRESKSEKTQNKERVERSMEVVEKSIETRIEKGESVSKTEIMELIKKHEQAIKHLKELMSKI